MLIRRALIIAFVTAALTGTARADMVLPIPHVDSSNRIYYPGHSEQLQNSLIPPPGTGLGGVKAGTPPVHQFGAGVDALGNQLYQQPSGNDLVPGTAILPGNNGKDFADRVTTRQNLGIYKSVLDYMDGGTAFSVAAGTYTQDASTLLQNVLGNCSGTKQKPMHLTAPPGTVFNLVAGGLQSFGRYCILDWEGVTLNVQFAPATYQGVFTLWATGDELNGVTINGNNTNFTTSAATSNTNSITVTAPADVVSGYLPGPAVGSTIAASSGTIPANTTVSSVTAASATTLTVNLSGNVTIASGTVISFNVGAQGDSGITFVADHQAVRHSVIVNTSNSNISNIGAGYNEVVDSTLGGATIGGCITSGNSAHNRYANNDCNGSNNEGFTLDLATNFSTIEGNHVQGAGSVPNPAHNPGCFANIAGGAQSNYNSIVGNISTNSAACWGVGFQGIGTIIAHNVTANNHNGGIYLEHIDDGDRPAAGHEGEIGFNIIEGNTASEGPSVPAILVDPEVPNVIVANNQAPFGIITYRPNAGFPTSSVTGDQSQEFYELSGPSANTFRLFQPSQFNKRVEIYNASVAWTIAGNFASGGAFQGPVVQGTTSFNFPAGALYSFISDGLSWIVKCESFGSTCFPNPPTLSAAGTSPTLSTGATDNDGTITEGSSATGFTLTFTRSYANARDCIVISPSGSSLTSYSATKTALTLANASASGNKYTYHCAGS